MINIAVEGESDRETARAVVLAAGGEVGKIHAAGGAPKLDPKIPKYHRAAVMGASYGGPQWVVFRDSDSRCPVELRNELMRGDLAWNDRFQLRIACSMTEAWLLADTEGFSTYFGVNLGKLPRDPDSLQHAKQSLLALAQQFSPRSIRDDIVTVEGKTGPLYVQRLNEFSGEHWDVEATERNSPSLARAVAAVRNLVV